jgi:hypothetical protein
METTTYQTCIKHLARNKQPGPDGIPNELLGAFPTEWHNSKNVTCGPMDNFIKRQTPTTNMEDPTPTPTMGKGGEEMGNTKTTEETNTLEPRERAGKRARGTQNCPTKTYKQTLMKNLPNHMPLAKQNYTLKMVSKMQVEAPT